MSVIYGSEAIALATVLDDSIRQLDVLGKIMPYSYVEQPEALDILNGEVEQILINNMDIETRFQHVLDRYSNSRGGLASEGDQLKRQVDEACAELKNGVHVMTRSLNHNPLNADNIKKVQEERLFLHQVLRETGTQLADDGSFGRLCETVEQELRTKQELQAVVASEEQSRQLIRELRRAVEEVRRQEAAEVQDRSEMVAHLKDQVQETKARTAMELKYVRARCEAQVGQATRRCQEGEAGLREELARLDHEVANEQRVHNETEGWLRDYTKELQAKTEHWRHKHAEDSEALKRALGLLTASKTKDLQRLQELSQTYSEYYKVVLEYRKEKEKERRVREKEALEVSAALRVQCWWRTVCVRQGLGPYGKKKKKKGGKKGKKGGKGGKKKGGKKKK